MKYIKKPVVIEAVVWTGSNLEEIREFCGKSAKIEIHDAAWQAGAVGVKADLHIDTLEGALHASVGDYIIRGVHGEFYPCKPDVFRETYDQWEAV